MIEVRTAAGLIERRINPASAEFRPELRMAGEAAHIVGYASVFDKLSRKLGGGFVEKVNQRAFSGSQGQGWPGVVCRYNHSDDWLLGTIQGNTLELRVDGSGLYYDVDVPQTRAGQDVITLCKRGDVVSSSFAFRVPDGGDDWGVTPYGFPLRTLLDAELIDVAPVNTPAYPDATAAARSIDGAVESLARFADADPAEVRNLLDNGQAMKFFKRTDRPSAQRKESDNTEERPEMTAKTAAELDAEARDKLTYKARKALPKTAFAYVDDKGVGHFPIHDASHVRNALARIAQGAQYGKEALPKVKAAAKRFGIDTSEQNDWLDILSEYRDFPEWFYDLSYDLDERIAAEEAEDRANTSSKASEDEEDADDDKADNAELNSGSPDDDDEDRGGMPPAIAEAIAKKQGKKPASEDEEDDDEDEKPSDADSKKKPAVQKRSPEDDARRTRLYKLRMSEFG